MMQHYDFSSSPKGGSANTSEETVSIMKPSEQALRNIKAYARSFKTIKAGDRLVKICLN